MNRRSIAGRLTLLLQSVAAAAILAFAVASLWITARALRSEEVRLLGETAHRVAAAVDDGLDESGGLEKAAQGGLTGETSAEFRIDIFDPSGGLVASTRHGGSPPLALPLPTPGRVDRRGGRVRMAALTGTGARVVASISERTHETTMRALTGAIVAVALPLLVFTVLMSRRMARGTLQPLTRMAQRAREVSVESGVRSLGDPSGIEEVDRLQESINRLLERLDDHLQAERRFTADASHELLTPLTVISGELELALARPSLPPSIAPGILKAAEQVRALRDLVEALLFIRRVSASTPARGHEFEPVNLTDLATRAVQSARDERPDRAADISVDAPDEVMVSGHEALLASAVRNLVDNAIKFTTPGKRVGITLRSNDGSAVVIVDDAGEGIAAGDRERVFDPFYRGAEARTRDPGFGLGLPIIRQVARTHGGEVTVADSPAGGARFTMTLPTWQPN